ncbi:STE/STE20/YSK protein kinase [Halenospora varia]|nr:STE/STE20/YSK protein kinase [Halenospora varia]
MESKLLRPVEVNSVKAKAEQDAKQMHQAVMAECAKTGKPPPPYGLTELIGKGTFGRVYKAKDFNTAGIVAVKIIDIDESDTLNPRNADALSDFMKEVNALKKLSESKARNINHVIEALPVGKAMWMITDYCGGGSVATLMKPTAPGGLVEKYIITIVREVAEAVGWVHAADIIHRDIKCANVLVTEQGGVQLCDFGVAGMIENKIDKRSTIIGTPHWMAPELFDAQPNYGKEVDIWAFGSLVYEVATGWPPNVSNGIPYQQLGSHLRQHTPRLEGGDYSDGLRDLVAYCLEELPSARPTIQQVQQHAYIANTSGRYPTSSLSQLVKAFREWEERGGSRKSLFMAGGAQGPSESNTAADDEWNFGTASSFDLEVSQRRSTQDLREATEFTEETKRPKGSRRRPPPTALSRLPPPLVKVFDPNTLSSYQDNVKNRYYPDDNRPPQTSDLPFRNDSMNNEVNDRVSMIDLGGHDPTTGISHFPSMDTLKPGARRIDEETDDYNSTLHDFSRPALSDPADVNPNRRTQDWKFPSMIPPASADPEVSRFPTSYEVPRPAVTPSTGGRPALVHHPTEPLGASFGGGLLGAGQPALDRRSIAESLIDLDMSLPDTFDLQRPSTANSDVGSTTSEQMGSENPFAFDSHVSYQAPVSDSLEPALYITEDTPPPPERSETTRDINEISDFSASEPEGPDPNDATRYDSQGFSDTDYISMPPPPRPSNASASNGLGEYSMSHFPALVDPPSKAALDGTASRAEMVGEVTRVLGSMTAQLEAFRDVYGEESGLRRGPGSRRRQ